MDIFTKIIERFFPPEPTTLNLGANLDTRAPQEIDQDYKLSEIVAEAAAVNWTAKRWEDFRRFPVQNQDGSGSCVWQTIRKLMRVLMKVNRGLDLDFSATFGYRMRKNYPQAGTIADDAWSIARKQGVTLNALLPSDNLSEAQMNAAKVEQYHRDVAEDFTMPNHVQIEPVEHPDFETVASVIQQTKKGVMAWFYFTDDEWSRREPKIMDNSLRVRDARARRHSVAVVDFGIYNGRKGLFIEDSAHFGGFYERFISREFFLTRCWYAAYPINFVFEPGAQTDPGIPSHKPSYDNSVKSLQDCLKYEGLFPANVESTGVLGPITTKAIKGFQAKYGLEQVGTVGPRTKAKLHELYP